MTASSDSGLAVTLSIDATSSAVCSLSGSTVSFTAVGTCTVDADQAGNANYNAAAQAHQTFAVAKAAQTVHFTSSAPAGAVYSGPSYTVTGSADSGLAVAFTIDSSSSGICSLSGSTVSFTGVGTCTIDGNQAGNANYSAAPQAQQSFAVGKASQTVSFTSSAPSNAVYGGPGYTVTASSDSGLAVTLSIDAASSAVCSLSGSTVSYTAAGTCTIDANQAGNASYNAASQAQQTFTIGKATPTVNWSNPADITYGTALDGTQLNATASVPGTFVYTPAAGTVLSPGNSQTLSVTFTPTDSTDYTNASANVLINVGFSQPCISGNAGGQTIGAGQAVCVTTGGNIGAVTISSGGSLWMQGGTVSGAIDASNGSAITLCGAHVSGHVFIDQDTGPVEIGGSSCAGNTITGNTQITNGTGGLSFVNNNVSGWITITNNTGGYTFSGNSASGTITTSGNS